MKKLLVIPLLLLLATGCGVSLETSDTDTINDYIDFYTDEDTCVNYIVYKPFSYGGNVTPRLNADGTVMLNEECLNEKGDKRK